MNEDQEHKAIGFLISALGRWPCIKLWFVESVDVIGNIHENPELIEGE